MFLYSNFHGIYVLYIFMWNHKIAEPPNHETMQPQHYENNEIEENDKTLILRFHDNNVPSLS